MLNFFCGIHSQAFTRNHKDITFNYYSSAKIIIVMNNCYCQVIISNGANFYNTQKVYKTVDTEWLKAMKLFFKT